MSSTKEASFEKIKVILLDIAGTTTSLEYVKEKLFAYIKDEVATFLKKNIEDDEVKKALEEIKEKDKDLDTDATVELIKKLTNEGSKNPGLKTLQGLISKEAYKTGTLQSHVYKDVCAALETWALDKKIAIYSTGNVESQKLFFENSTEGNLTSHISNYFDLSIGSKTEPESYTKIINELNVASDEILYINDDAEELAAGKKVGLLTALIKREGNTPVDEEISKEFTITVSTFADISLDTSNKRKMDTIDGSEDPPSKIPKTEESKSATTVSEGKEMEEDNNSKEPQIADNTETLTSNDIEKETSDALPKDEPMEVDSLVKQNDTNDPKTLIEASTEISSMEVEESNKVEDSTTNHSEKTATQEDSTEVTEKIEVKNIETETKTDNSNEAAEATVSTCSNSEDGIITAEVEKNVEVTVEDKKIDEKGDLEKVSVEETPVEISTEKTDSTVKVASEEINAEQALPETGVDVPEKVTTEATVDEPNKEVTVAVETVVEEKSATETQEVVEAAKVDSKTEIIETKSIDESVTKSVDQVPCSKEAESDNSDNKDTKTDKGSEDKIEITETKSAEEIDVAIKEANNIGTNNSDNTDVINTGKTVVDETNGVSKSHENGNANENKKNDSTCSSDEVTNGVANGQENGDKSAEGKKTDDESEIKVKKLETNEGSPAVAVEV